MSTLQTLFWAWLVAIVVIPAALVYMAIVYWLWEAFHLKYGDDE